MNVLNGLPGLLLTVGNDAYPRALTLLAQVTLPLIVGRLIRHLLRSCTPAARLLLANGTLFAVCAVTVLSLSLTGRYRALWTFTLAPRITTASIPLASLHSAAATRTLLTDLPRDVMATRQQTRPFVSDLLTRPAQARLLTRNGGGKGSIPSSRATVRAGRTGFQTAGPDIAIGSGVTDYSVRQNALGTVAAERLPQATWSTGFITLWCGGTVLHLVWFSLSCLSTLRLRHRCLSIQDDANRLILLERSAALRVWPPQLLVCDRVRGPLLTGLLRPAIVLPSTYQSDFTPEDLSAVLTHELAHLAQRDGWWTLLARLICAVCWPHPLLWALCRDRAEAGEEACDMVVLAQGCSGTAYARCLLALAERLQPSRMQRAATLGMVGSRSTLSRRIEGILRGWRRSPQAISINIKLPIFVLVPALVCAALYCVGTSGRGITHNVVVAAAFTQASGSNPKRLRTLEAACDLVRQQVAVAQSRKNISLNALLQQTVQVGQLGAQIEQAQAKVVGAEAQINGIQIQANLLRQELQQPRVAERADTEARRRDLAVMEAERTRMQAQLSESLAQHASVRALVVRHQAVMEQLRRQMTAEQLAVIAAQRWLARLELELQRERAKQSHGKQAALEAARATVAARSMGLAATVAAEEAAKRSSTHQYELTILQQQLRQYQAQREALAAQLSERDGTALARINTPVARENVQPVPFATNAKRLSSEELSREEVWNLMLKLIDAKAQLAKLRTEYSANHPRMTAGQEWVSQLSRRLQKLMVRATPDVQYDVLGLESDELRHERNDAMDDLVDLKTKYTDTNPRARAADERLHALDLELEAAQQRRNAVYDAMKAGFVLPGASLVITRSMFHFAGDPPPTDYIFRTHYVDTHKLPAGPGISRTDSPIDEGEEVQWEINVSGYTGKTMEIQLRRVSEYYDRDGHLIQSDSRTVHNEVYEIGSGRTTIHSGTEPAKPGDFPAGTATVKYRYELKAQIRNENGPHTSATQSSATHTMTIEK